METTLTSRSQRIQYHFKRRNAVAYNPDTSCTEDKDNLIAHIMATKPPVNQNVDSKLLSQEIQIKLILKNV